MHASGQTVMIISCLRMGISIHRGNILIDAPHHYTHSAIIIKRAFDVLCRVVS